MKFRLDSFLTQLLVQISLCTIALATVGGMRVVAESQWVSFGRASNGEVLQLDIGSVTYRIMPVNDRINTEGMAEEDIRRRIPHHRVLAFEYKIGERKRKAYTAACQGGQLLANPSWRTFTTYIDHWPQYFSVPAHSLASQKLLREVCGLGLVR
jgi:hypothetical protein